MKEKQLDYRSTNRFIKTLTNNVINIYLFSGPEII